jgi:hypothetical protein
LQEFRLKTGTAISDNVLNNIIIKNKCHQSIE